MIRECMGWHGGGELVFFDKTNRLIEQWLENNDTQRTMWPSQSPDINIMKSFVSIYMARDQSFKHTAKVKNYIKTFALG